MASIIYGDKLMIIFAREILQRRPGATFISEVKCSQTMYDDIEKHGGRAIMWKTGHSLIKKKMKEENAALAGEMSGHMFFADRYFGYDDATYAACRLLEILSDTGQTISRPCWPTCRLHSPRPKSAWSARTDENSRWSRRVTDVFRKDYESSTSTGFGCFSTTAGAWCAPPTPSRPWCYGLKP